MTIDIVVIGASKGGISALEVIFQYVRPPFPVPVVLVLHRSYDSNELFLEMLKKHLLVELREPNDKELIANTHLFTAPAAYHLSVDQECFHLSTEAPVCYSRPSVDVLFESVAKEYSNRSLGVLLSGHNHDGAEGGRLILEYGGNLMIQDPESSEVEQMPRSALGKAGGKAAVLTPKEIGLTLAGIFEKLKE